jgi:CubicO group peptidase (beta-lactamase class C family)
VSVVQGSCDEGFSAVADEFARIVSLDDAGSGLAVYHQGRKVVDLWGGLAVPSTGEPWTERSLTLVFSVTKGLTALCAHMLAEQGLLDLDARVDEYWPEYGAHGKDVTTVRHALSHRAGVPVVDAVLTPSDLASWTPIIRALEQQRPLWVPGESYGYHALTFGYVVGEVIRRVTGCSVGEYFRRHVAEPLGADTFIGLPEEQEPRVVLQRSAPAPPEGSEVATMLAELMTPDGLIVRSTTLGGAVPAGLDLDQPDGFNSRLVRAAELPAGNAMTTAEGLARVYAAVVNEVDGVRLLGPDAAKAALTVESSGPPAEGFVDFGISFSTGFQVAHPDVRPMLGPSSFGHDGAGGSLGFVDLGYEVGFGYVSCQMGGFGDQRANDLCRVLRRCLDGGAS